MPIRNLLIWGAIARLLVVLFSAFQSPNSNRGAVEHTYSQFLAEVQAGKVKSVETVGESVRGSTTDGKSFVTYIPAGSMQDTVR